MLRTTRSGCSLPAAAAPAAEGVALSPLVRDALGRAARAGDLRLLDAAPEADRRAFWGVVMREARAVAAVVLVQPVRREVDGRVRDELRREHGVRPARVAEPADEGRAQARAIGRAVKPMVAVCRLRRGEFEAARPLIAEALALPDV